MTDKIIEINKDDFYNTISNNRFVVVDFYSTECPPCEALSPKLKKISEKYDDILFLKIFRQGNRELAEKLTVMSSPTLLFFKDGEESGTRLSGFIEYEELEKSLLNLVK